MSSAAVNGINWVPVQSAVVERLRGVLMPDGQPGLINRLGVARDLASIKEPELRPPEVYVVYALPKLSAADASRAKWRHVFAVVTIVPQQLAASQQRTTVDLSEQMQHEEAIPIVQAISQALHGWPPGVTGFGALVPEQGPPVGYSDLGNAFVTLRFGCDAVSVAQPGVNPMAGRPR